MTLAGVEPLTQLVIACIISVLAIYVPATQLPNQTECSIPDFSLS